MSRSDWSSQSPHGGLGGEVPAEGDGRRVGAWLADCGHLVADAVSPYCWHGVGTVQCFAVDEGHGVAMAREL